MSAKKRHRRSEPKREEAAVPPSTELPIKSSANPAIAPAVASSMSTEEALTRLLITRRFVDFVSLLKEDLTPLAQLRHEPVDHHVRNALGAASILSLELALGSPTQAKMNREGFLSLVRVLSEMLSEAGPDYDTIIKIQIAQKDKPIE